MATEWTQERVTQLAPDAASLKAGQGLAHAKKWVSSGRDELSVWGECQGSGAKPYQVRFDLAEATSKCSCPSRKFPCKHVLGLMLILTSSPDAISAQAMPPWVEEWVDARAEQVIKKAAKAESPPKPVDEESQAKRAEKRLARIAEGLAALKTWSEDLVRGGIATLPGKGYAFFDEAARRLIDAQAPGVATRIQRLGQIASSGAGWQQRFTEKLASVHLLIRAFESIDALPEALRNDVLAAVGVPLRTEEVAALPGMADTWQIIAQEVGIEDKLRVQRTWLFGSRSRRPALVLAFAHGNAPLDPSLAAATCFEGELSFFPGNQLRAVVKSRGDLKPISDLQGLATLDEFCNLAGGLFAQAPWLDELAAPLRQVIPAREGDGWVMIDFQHRVLPAALSDAAGWLALAVSGGNTVDVAAGFDGRTLRPLAIFSDGQYISLSGAGVQGA
jgi:hypothetical protein